MPSPAGPARAVATTAAAVPGLDPPAGLWRTISRLPYFTVLLSVILIYRFKAELAAATDWEIGRAHV